MASPYVAPTVSEVCTSDPDIAHATLVEGYSPTRPVAFSGDFTDFQFATSAASAGSLSTATIRHTAATLARTEPYEPFIAGFARAGRLNFRTSHEDVLVDHSHAVRYSTDLPLAVQWDDVDLLVIMFPMTTIEQTAATLPGGDPSDFRFVSTAPASLTLSRFWRSTLTHVDHDLRAEGSLLGYPLVQAETLGMLAAAALTVFPNTTMTQDYQPGPGSTDAAVVRRAVDFIDNHARQPLTVTDIAAAAGVSPQALHAAFRQHRDTTPRQHLRQTRLEGAHHDLHASHPAAGATVRDIAARWGFTNPGRFTALYRATYGVLPSHTLRT